MRFEDFVLHLDSTQRGDLRARVLKSPFGEGSAVISSPIPTGDSALSLAPRELGAALFQAVFQGQVRTLLDKSLGLIERSPDLGLRLEIKVDPTDEQVASLSELPWELLCNDETRDCLALSRKISIVRYLDVPRSAQSIPFTQPLRILAVGASPEGLEPLDLGTEALHFERLQKSSPEVSFRFLSHAPLGATLDALTRDAYHVLHFTGHSLLDPASGEAVFVFEGPKGAPQLVSARELATKLRDLPSLGVVVLTCNPAHAMPRRGPNRFDGVLTSLVRGGIPAVVTLRWPITDTASARFNEAFYRSLARGGSLDEAVSSGRQAIHSVSLHESEWASPVLFLRTVEGNVLLENREVPSVEPPMAPLGPPIVPAVRPHLSPRRWLVPLLLALVAILLILLLSKPRRSREQRPQASAPEITRVLRTIERESVRFIETQVRQIRYSSASTWDWTVQEETEAPQPPMDPGLPPPTLEPLISQREDIVAVQPEAIPRPTEPTTDVSPEAFDDVEIRREEQVRDTEPALRAFGKLPWLSKRKESKKQQIAACIKQRAWIAYFRDDIGVLEPVRDTLNTDEDEAWVGLKFTEFDGLRIRLGVLHVIDKSAESEERDHADKIEVPVSGIQEMLTVALYNTKRFDVIEQKRVQEVETQQTRKDLVEPSPGSITNIGKVLGAQYLVYGTVNEWHPERDSKSTGRPGGLFNAGKKEAEVAITFTLTDVGSGQILFTTLERARMGEWSFGSGAPGQATPVGYAVRACANKAAYKIADFLKNRKWKGSVVDIKKGDVYINAGSQQGMAPMTKLSVQAVRGVVKDRETGTVLGEDLSGIGTLEVVSVQKAFSIARIIQGCESLKLGDRVELATDPIMPPVLKECLALESQAR